MAKKVHYVYTTLSPIFQSDFEQKASGNKNAVKQRTMSVAITTAEGLKIEELPIISGNSIRGKNRRLFIDKTLEALGLKNGWQYDTSISTDVYLLLISGGNMSKSKDVKLTVQGYINTLNLLPFLALFGGFYQGVQFDGRLSAGFLIPAVDGCFFDEGIKKNIKTVQFNPAGFNNKIGFVRTKINQINEIFFESLAPVKEINKDIYNGILNLFREVEVEEETEATAEETAQKSSNKKPKGKYEQNKEKLQKILKDNRKDAEEIIKLIEPDIISIEEPEKVLIEILEQKLSTQMIYSVQGYIPAGINLVATDILNDGLGSDELVTDAFAAYIETVSRQSYIGGMGAKGFGRVDCKVFGEDGEPYVPNGEKYWNWLKNNRDKIIDVLKNIDKYLAFQIQ